MFAYCDKIHHKYNKSARSNHTTTTKQEREVLEMTLRNGNNSHSSKTNTSNGSSTGAPSGYYLSSSNFSNENYTDSNPQISQHQHQASVIAPNSTTAGNNNIVSGKSSNSNQHNYRYQASQAHPSTTYSAVPNNSTDANMVNYELESATTTPATQAVNQKIANLSSVSFNNNNQPNGANPGSGILGDLTNLTPEEKKKLEEIRMKRSKLTYEIQKLKEEISCVKKEMNRLDHANDGNSGINGGPSKDDIAQRAKQLSIGKKKFNMDPKKGIEFLIANNLLKNTTEDVAKFLYKGESLNKTAIGNYLGEKIDFNLKVLDDFIELHDFQNLILVQALRQFLWSFRLPGEAQKIDRMMEKFAAHYCQQNPTVFSNTDTCFVLSFSIIMLNTSLHNPNVKDKMTAEKFIVMNRGINNGGDLSRSLIISLFESIRQEPFKIPEDDGNDLMQGGLYKSWKRRWFILNDKCLYYFEYTTDKEPRGIIPLENVDIREISDRGGRQFCFELYSAIGEVIKACKTDTEGRVIEGRHSVYRMAAATVEEKDAWVEGIRASTSRSPFYEMLAARKRKAIHHK